MNPHSGQSQSPVVIPRPCRARGFTFAELLIGLAISAIVLTALAMATLSISQCWANDDGTQQLSIQSNQIALRVRHNLAAAEYIGLVQPGSLDGSASTPACVFYWAYDGFGGTADAGPQVGEMALIQHDPTTGSLWLYQPIPVSQMSSTQLAEAATQITWSEMNDPTWPATFESLDYVQPTLLGSSVSGATFAINWLGSTTQRPLVEMTLTLNRSPQSPVTEYSSFLLRAPSTQPSP